MEHIAAVDLHSDNGYYGIVEPDGKRIYQRSLPKEINDNTDPDYPFEACM